MILSGVQEGAMAAGSEPGVTVTTAGELANCERRAQEVIAAARAEHEEW